MLRPDETDRNHATERSCTAILGNPLFLVKARMQAYSPFNPVGAQHHYTSALNGLVDIVRKEGVKGLARGVDAAMLRTAMGSSVQLPAYNLAKTTLNGWGVGDHAGLFLLSSVFSGLCVCTVMQPAGASFRFFVPGSFTWPSPASSAPRLPFVWSCADTVLTRMYNQSPNSIGPDGKPRGLLCQSSLLLSCIPRPGRQETGLPLCGASAACSRTSQRRTDRIVFDLARADKNPVHCLFLTWKTEGFFGLYRGTLSHLLRIAPHTVSLLPARCARERMAILPFAPYRTGLRRLEGLTLKRCGSAGGHLGGERVHRAAVDAVEAKKSGYRARINGRRSTEVLSLFRKSTSEGAEYIRAV